MAVPKYKRPAKVGNAWPGLTYSDVHFVFPNHPHVTQYPWQFHCPAPLCFYVIHAATQEIAEKRIQEHPCPWFGGGTTTLSWGIMSQDYLGPIWEMMDKEVDIIFGTNRPSDWDDDRCRREMQGARYRARGIAETLAILMPPFFDTGDQIVNEAKVRWQNRVDGTDYETPGIGRLRFKRPEGVSGNDVRKMVPEEYDPSAPPKHNLTDDEVAAVQKAKGFPLGMLASAYNTTEDIIKYLQGV